MEAPGTSVLLSKGHSRAAWAGSSPGVAGRWPFDRIPPLAPQAHSTSPAHDHAGCTLSLVTVRVFPWHVYTGASLPLPHEGAGPACPRLAALPRAFSTGTQAGNRTHVLPRTGMVTRQVDGIYKLCTLVIKLPTLLGKGVDCCRRPRQAHEGAVLP